MEVFREIYSMIYDSPSYGNNGLGDYLGKFRKVKQLREDAWIDDFIGVNTETGELCVILSREVCGHGGGIAYRVVPVKDIGNNTTVLADIPFAEWLMVIDDYDDGVGSRKLPHCSRCGRGVYNHDAGMWCPFCGAAMKNPMRY